MAEPLPMYVDPHGQMVPAPSRLKVRLGFAPITWNNEDVEVLHPAVPFTVVLDEIVAAGYEATELGDGFPRDPATLRAALDERGLSLPSGWCGLALVGEETREADLEHMRRVCDLLTSVGASYVNLAHAGTPERRAWAGRATYAEAPRLDERGQDALAARVTEVARVAREAGLQAAFHPHAGTWVETREEIESLLSRSDPDLVKLCWDVGHALYGGIDPVTVVREHPDRIAYVHLKDVDERVLQRLQTEGASFDQAIRQRVFCELGTGLLDVSSLLQALEDVGYEGWLMVEQDSSWLDPIDSARMSRTYLRLLGL